MSSKEELYKVLVESVPYGTLFFAYGVCVDANQNALNLLGCELKQLIGASLDKINGDESTALVDLKLQLKKAQMGKQKTLSWTCPGRHETPIYVEVVYVTDDGKEMVVMLKSEQDKDSPFSGSLGRQGSTSDTAPSGLDSLADRWESLEDSAVTSDDNPELIVDDSGRVLSERRVAERRADDGQKHYFDGLTSLPNRQMLAESLADFLEIHHGGSVCAAVMMLDLDHFKDINDSWGHSVGDQVIKKIGQALGSLVSGDNMLARMSGDEFVLFIPELSDEPSKAAWNAQAIAEKLGEAVASPIFLDGHEVILTASIGIALLTDADLTADRVLQYADTAMYEAKRKGRNSIAFFDPSITQKAQRQIGLNTRLRKAMDNHEFVLYIQPQISVETGEMLGGEALLRWMNADKVTNMPSEFIPVLESSGLIVDVGRWVIRTSCEYLRNFIDMGIWQDHMRLGINISPRQFRDPQLIDIVQHSMKSYNIDPSYLNFEVTESLVIEDVDDAIKKMEAIKSLGSMFSIDDFGIGYSSMIYLKRLPFDQLKIDREFIRNIHRDTESRGIVEAIMAVSKQYGLKVTAEGVESQEALDILRELGCHSYQGSHFSMPVPCDRFTKLLAA
ncbi:MAG: EAL domain-containing protein [Gammaproteobacteria bacterium]|nr:MAG: EAL domain-containing protein [Gammaproteobacteria bacterium]